jgi:hypothetical protein
VEVVRVVTVLQLLAPLELQTLAAVVVVLVRLFLRETQQAE